jgi:hypothetical protein
MSKMALWKKSTVRDFFGPFFSLFDRFWGYRDLSKNSPHKKHCAWGPTPPPGNFIKFIDFYRFLTILGSSIEPEKGEVKSASTPYPPWKVNFIAIYWKLG